MRQDQVNALIEHAKEDLGKISEEYNSALEKQTISPGLQIDIKNYMENLRSALDYLAHDIYEQKIHPSRVVASKPEVTKIYFPYGKTENDFKSGVGSSLPDLKNISTTLYDLVESIQPYKIGDDWLNDFCNTLNEKKHNKLTPQTREETRGLTTDFGGGTGISMGPGTSISGSGFLGTSSGGIHLQGDTISGDSPARRTSGNVKQTVIRWVSFKFDGTNVDVLPMLHKAIAGIPQVSKEVYNNL